MSKTCRAGEPRRPGATPSDTVTDMKSDVAFVLRLGILAEIREIRGCSTYATAVLPASHPQETAVGEASSLARLIP